MSHRGDREPVDVALRLDVDRLQYRSSFDLPRRSSMSNDRELFDRLHDVIESDDPSRADERRIDSGDGLDPWPDDEDTPAAYSSDPRPVVTDPSGDRLECEECSEAIVYGVTGWSHVMVPDVPHWPTPACTCERGDAYPDPYCRVHGLEDVTSGCYDCNPTRRKQIDREIARVWGDR